MDDVDTIVTVDRRHDIDSVVEGLKSRGMLVRGVLRSVWVVTGASGDHDALRSVSGVKSVTVNGGKQTI